MKTNKTSANSAKKVNETRVNNAAKTAKVEAVEVNEVLNEQATYAPVVVETAKGGKVESKEVLKAANVLKARVKAERRGANCTIRLIAERAASGDSAAVDVLCALCDVPRAALFSLNIDTIRAAVNAYYPYYTLIIERDKDSLQIVSQRRVSVKPVGVWYTTANGDEKQDEAAKRVKRGFKAVAVADYLDQLIKAAKCRAKGVHPRRVDAEAVYCNIELSEAAEGVTATEIDEAKQRKGYLSGKVNVWKKDRNGYYI